MSNNSSANSHAKNKNGCSPKNQSNRRNNRQQTNEFCSYNSSTTLSTYYFGLNIFDYYTQEQLASLVKDPIGNNEILRKISLCYIAQMVYTQIP